MFFYAKLIYSHNVVKSGALFAHIVLPFMLLLLHLLKPTNSTFC